MMTIITCSKSPILAVIRLLRVLCYQSVWYFCVYLLRRNRECLVILQRETGQISPPYFSFQLPRGDTSGARSTWVRHNCILTRETCAFNTTVPGVNSVQFGPLTYWVFRGHEGRFSRDSLPVFSAGGPCEQFWHCQGCPLFDVVHPAFHLPTTALPTLQGALKDGFGEAMVTCDMPKPCKFPFLDSCQKRFLWTIRENKGFYPLRRALGIQCKCSYNTRK